MAFSVTVTKIDQQGYSSVTRAVRGSEVLNLRPSVEGNTSSAAIFEKWNGAATQTWYVTQTYASVLSSMTTDEAESGSEVLTNKATDFATINDTLYPSVAAVVENFNPINYIETAGTSSAYTATLTGVVPTAYYAGMKVTVKMHTQGAATPTINVNGLGAKPIRKFNDVPMVAADLQSGYVYELTYDGTLFLVNIDGASNVAGQATGTDTYALTINYPSAYTSRLFSFVVANTNTGAATLNINGLGAKDLTKGTNGTTALAASDLVVGKIYTAQYDGTRIQITNL